MAFYESKQEKQKEVLAISNIIFPFLSFLVCDISDEGVSKYVYAYTEKNLWDSCAL